MKTKAKGKDKNINIVTSTKYTFQSSLFRSFLLLTSCFCFFLLKSDVAIVNLFLSIVFSFVTYLFCCNYYKKIKRRSLLAIGVITVIYVVVLILNEPIIFSNKWINSNRALYISNLININLDVLLYVLSCAMSLFSVFFLCAFIVSLYTFVKELCEIIDFKTLVGSMFTTIKKHSIKYYLFIILKNILIVVIFVFVGTFLLILTFETKNEQVSLNVQKSAYLIKDEGSYPKLYNYCQSKLDNYTDAIMLLEAADDYDDSLLNKALLVYRDSTNEEEPYDVLINKYVNNINPPYKATYARYWHGYLVFLIPLLSIMNYVELRLVNGVCQTLLAIIMIIILYKKKMKRLILPYIISILMLCLPAIASSLQFSSCYYIMTIGSLFILVTNKTKFNTGYIFLLIGISVAYFDFLTYPIATFGFPMAMYYAINTNKKTENRIYDLIRFGLYWALGYSVMWFSKWIIASLLTDQNVIKDALTKILSRTSSVSSAGSKYSIINVIKNNVRSFVKTPFIIAFVALLLLYLYKINRTIVSNKINREQFKIKVRLIIPYMLIFFLPFIWYAFATNHSAIHYFFTNKALIVSSFSIMTSLIELESELRK